MKTNLKKIIYMALFIFIAGGASAQWGGSFPFNQYSSAQWDSAYNASSMGDIMNRASFRPEIYAKKADNVPASFSRVGYGLNVTAPVGTTPLSFDKSFFDTVLYAPNNNLKDARIVFNLESQADLGDYLILDHDSVALPTTLNFPWYYSTANFDVKIDTTSFFGFTSTKLLVHAIGNFHEAKLTTGNSGVVRYYRIGVDSTRRVINPCYSFFANHNTYDPLIKYNAAAIDSLILQANDIRLLKDDNGADIVVRANGLQVQPGSHSKTPFYFDLSQAPNLCKKFTFDIYNGWPGIGYIIVDGDTLFSSGTLPWNVSTSTYDVSVVQTLAGEYKVTIDGTFDTVKFNAGSYFTLTDMCLDTCSFISSDTSTSECEDFQFTDTINFYSGTNHKNVGDTVFTLANNTLPVVLANGGAAAGGYASLLVLGDYFNVNQDVMLDYRIDSTVYSSISFTVEKSNPRVPGFYINADTTTAYAGGGVFATSPASYYLPSGVKVDIIDKGVISGTNSWGAYSYNVMEITFTGYIENILTYAGGLGYPYTQYPMFDICLDKNIAPDTNTNICNIDPTFRWNRGQNNNAQFHALDINNNYGYQWDYGDGNTDNGHTNQHFYGAPGTYYVCLTITNRLDSSCTDTYCDSVTVVNQPPIFTPDGDGIDDTYLAPCISKIYNRNGVLVRTLSGPSLVWDGKDDSGNLLPRGQYTIICDADNSTTRVTLFR